MLVVRNPPATALEIRDSVHPSAGRSPGGGNGSPLQYSCLVNPWTEEAGGVCSMGLRRVRDDWRDWAGRLLGSVATAEENHPRSDAHQPTSSRCPRCKRWLLSFWGKFRDSAKNKTTGHKWRHLHLSHTDPNQDRLNCSLALQETEC